jgi:hypothetical protein
LHQLLALLGLLGLLELLGLLGLLALLRLLLCLRQVGRRRWWRDFHGSAAAPTASLPKRRLSRCH